jgi:hypothetical protein
MLLGSIIFLSRKVKGKCADDTAIGRMLSAKSMLVMSKAISLRVDRTRRVADRLSFMSGAEAKFSSV